MIKHLSIPAAKAVLVSCVLVALTAAAGAQVPSSDLAPGHTDPYTNDPYITSTGATVPKPGLSQSGPTTPQEFAIQRQNNKIDQSICKGC